MPLVRVQGQQLNKNKQLLFGPLRIMMHFASPHAAIARGLAGSPLKRRLRGPLRATSVTSEHSSSHNSGLCGHSRPATIPYATGMCEDFRHRHTHVRTIINRIPHRRATLSGVEIRTLAPRRQKSPKVHYTVETRARISAANGRSLLTWALYCLMTGKKFLQRERRLRYARLSRCRFFQGILEGL